MRTLLPGASLRPPLAFDPRHRRLSTPTDAFELHPDVASYGPSTLKFRGWSAELNFPAEEYARDAAFREMLRGMNKGEFIVALRVEGKISGERLKKKMKMKMKEKAADADAAAADDADDDDRGEKEDAADAADAAADDDADDDADERAFTDHDDAAEEEEERDDASDADDADPPTPCTRAALRLAKSILPASFTTPTENG